METKFELCKARAFRQMQQMGHNVDDLHAYQYELILESGLKSTEDIVIFPVGVSRMEKDFITEVRLRNQDIFECHKWGLFLLDTHGGSDIEFQQHTFPDRTYFSKGEAAKAEVFYNADLSLVMNNLIVLPGVRTDRFRKYLSAIEWANIEISALQQVPGDGLLLFGHQNIYFRLDLLRKTNWESSETRLRLRLSGILFKNAGIIM